MALLSRASGVFPLGRRAALLFTSRPRDVRPFGTGSMKNSAEDSRRLRIVQVVARDSTGVRVSYSDGASSNFRYVWLRDSCQCPECYDEVHRFKRNSWKKLDIAVQPSQLWVTKDGHLGIQWPEEEEETPCHKSVFHCEWLQNQGKCFSDSVNSVTRVNDRRAHQKFWNASILTAEGLPTVDYRYFLDSRKGLLRWLDLFYAYGFCILKGVPVSKTCIEDVATRLAYIRTSSFGYLAEVKSDPLQSMHPGYRGDPLGLHTDLPYRERSPGVLLLHFLQAADPATAGPDAGGQTLLVDGLYVAHWMHQNHPKEFRILTSTPLPYGYRDPTTGLNYSGYWPVIYTDPVGRIAEIHYSAFSRQPVQMADDKVLPFYRAFRIFEEKLTASVIRFYLKQGDLIVIHNRRILHGRTAFDPSKVIRHFMSCYLDLDEVLNRYDLLLNQSAEGH